MSRSFDSNNSTVPIIKRIFFRAKWENSAYPERNGMGPPVVKNLNFVERNQYGFVDQDNNSIIQSYIWRIP